MQKGICNTRPGRPPEARIRWLRWKGWCRDSDLNNWTQFFLTPPVAVSGEKDEKRNENAESCTKKVKRHSQGISSARKEHRSGWQLQVAESNQGARLAW